MEAAKQVSTFLNSFNITGCGKANFSGCSAEFSELSVPELGKLFGLKSSGDNTTAVVSSAALTEILQHVVGIGSALGKIDFTGKHR